MAPAQKLGSDLLYEGGKKRKKRGGKGERKKEEEGEEVRRAWARILFKF